MPDPAGHRPRPPSTALVAHAAPGLAVAARVVLAVGGGYALAAGLVALLAAGLPWTGMGRAEAAVLAGMLGILLYLGLLLWAFAERRLPRLAAAALLGAPALFAAARLLAPFAVEG